MPGEDPKLYTDAFFVLEVGGIGHTNGIFTKMSGISNETEIIEHKVGDAKGRPLVVKVPGRIRWSDITFSRGLDEHKEIWNWRKQVVDGKINEARKDGTITVYGSDGTQLAMYKFTGGWPSKYETSPWDHSSSAIMLETLTIAVENVEYS